MKSLTKEQACQENEYAFPYHYLDLRIDSYKYIWSLPYLNLIKEIKKLMQPYKGQKILDIGCGDGRLCYELRKENVEVMGIDYSEQAISFAKAFNPKTRFIVQDLQNLRLSAHFDYVIFMEVIEHIPPEKIPQIIKKTNELLKEDGKLIITVPSTKLPLAPKHYQHFTEESLEKTIKSYFKITKIIWSSNTGIKKKYFNLIKKIALILYPFRNKSKLSKRLLVSLQNYYQKNIAIAPRLKGEGIIVLCEKIK